MVRTFLVAVVLASVPAVAWAQADKPVPTIKREAVKPTSSADGGQMYTSYCAACHGKLGRGDGPAAPALKVKPADLTLLKKNHGGMFSAKDFEEKINGVSMSAAHGSTDMPVWGPIFREIAGSPELRIFNLKKYIDAMQTP
jgi:mono/diheme cytochrome c family protein